MEGNDKSDKTQNHTYRRSIMSKAHRGTGIREQVNCGRGACPVCKRDGIKVLYEVSLDGETKKVCKQCKAKLAK